MNFTDIFFLLVVVTGMLLGYRKGFISSGISLMNICMSTAIAFISCGYVGSWWLPWVSSNDTDQTLVAFASIFLLSLILMSLLQRWLMRSYTEMSVRSVANRIIGIFPGALCGLVFSAIIFYSLSDLPLRDDISKDIRTSATADFFERASELINERMPDQKDLPYENIASATQHTASKENAVLPFFSTEFNINSDLESAMLVMINDERKKHHLRPLAADSAMRNVARAHSEDMFRRGYFSHNTPEGLDPFERMQRANISFRVAGENLAISPDLDKAFKGLMNSPEHRANILNSEFGRVGIGIAEDTERGLMISQEFRD